MSKTVAAPKAKKNLDAFRAQHDRSVTVPAKIKAGLEALRKAEGPEAWEYEGEFMKRAGISSPDMGKFRDQFEAHIVQTNGSNGKTPKRVWFVDVKTATTARDAIS